MFNHKNISYSSHFLLFYLWTSPNAPSIPTINSIKKNISGTSSGAKTASKTNINSPSASTIISIFSPKLISNIIYSSAQTRLMQPKYSKIWNSLPEKSKFIRKSQPFFPNSKNLYNLILESKK